MSPTSTSVSTYTRTQTATYLTEVVMGSIANILANLKIDLTILYRDWKQDEAAISAWIEEESLEQVVLQCHRPNGAINPIIEFPVAYTASGKGDATFTADRAALARFQVKLDRVPTGTTYTLFCTFRKAHTTQPGWSPSSRASTHGLQSLKFGTLASAPHAALAMRYLH